MYDLNYWERRIRNNTQPLAAGDLKLLLGALFNEIEKLNEQIQSLGPKGARSTGKKLEAKRDSASDSAGDA